MGINEISTILFDLDGTLLPMDQDLFIEAHLQTYSQKCEQLGLDPNVMIYALESGLKAMFNNDGNMTNKQRFWESFLSVAKLPGTDSLEEFMQFYLKEFKTLKSVVFPTPLSKEIIKTAHAKGYQLVLATTPVFPRQATLERMAWIDLDPAWFDLITTYEDFSYTKPHLGYYRQILAMLDINPTNCLMVGNDMVEDLVVEELGMQTYLVTDWIINPSEKDISPYRKGSLQDLWDYVQKLDSKEGA